MITKTQTFSLAVKDNLWGGVLVTSGQRVIKCNKASNSAKISPLGDHRSYKDYLRRGTQRSVGTFESSSLDKKRIIASYRRIDIQFRWKKGHMRIANIRQ